MRQSSQTSYVLSLVISLLYLVFLVSLVFTFNFFSTVSIGLILLMGVIKNKVENKTLIDPNAKNLFLIACLLYYLFQVASLLYTHNYEETFAQLRIKSALLGVPLALCGSNYINANNREKLLFAFCFILFIASLYCLAINTVTWFQNHDTSIYFFHSLIKPIHQHAVFFSIYIFIVLLFLFEEGGAILNRSFQIFLIIYFSIFIFLLSSKLVIAFYLVYLLYYAIVVLLKQKTSRPIAIGIVAGCILSIVLLLTTRNPISDRFTEVLNTDMKLVKQDKFNPGIYFNDVQFRIIEWRLVTEILNDNDSWWKGITSGNSQDLLDKKYIEKDMYVGDPSRGDKGFLRYNTHNELLESLLQSGIPGAILFLLIIAGMVQITYKKRNRLLNFTITLLIAFSLIESVFETQYAIMLFTFFPLFLGLDGKENEQAS